MAAVKGSLQNAELASKQIGGLEHCWPRGQQEGDIEGPWDWKVQLKPCVRSQGVIGCAREEDTGAKE